MKTKHRLLALLLSLCMILSLMPLGAMAAGEGGNVAKIGSEEYATFALALAAANADPDASTITLLKDCTFTGDSISEPLTIEGDSKTLTMSNGNDYAYINVVGDTAINKLTIKSEVPDGKADVFHVKSELTMTGCTVNTNKPENGMFNIANNGKLTLVSGTYTAPADGKITSGASFSMKTGNGTNGVNITQGTIRLNKGAFITLLADSAAPTNSFNIQPSESTTETQNAAAGDVLLKGSASNVAIDAIAAKITVGDGKSWDVTKGSAGNANNLVMHQLDNVKYVHAPQLGTANNGSLANPFTTLQAAYNALPNGGGEIRVLYDMTTAETLDCSEAKAVTITSAYRYNNISLKPGTHSWTVTRGKALENKTACTVSAGSVTLKNIVFDGGAKWGNEGLLARTNSGIRNLDSAGAGANFAGMLFTVSSGGTLTLGSGAVLQNNDRQHSAESGGDRGSAVYVNGGTLTMNDGASIQNNRVTNAVFGNIGDGAAVAVWGNTGTFTMNGGTITGNTVGRMGGAIRVADTGSTMKLYGGSITGNATKSAADCGGISVNDGTLYLKGAPVVKDNLQNAKECNIIYKATIVMDDRLTSGANIGVWADSAMEVTTETAESGDAAYVHSDNRQLKVEFDSTAKKLKLVSDPNAYVSASGSDSGDGSKELPYKTIGTAYAQVATGGTIYVMTDLAPAAITNFDTADKAVTITSCKANGDAWASAADTHTIKRNVQGSLFTINKGTVTLTNVTLTDKTHHVNSPICIGNDASADTPILVMATGATITGTESDYAAVYMFKGEMTMESGSTIKGNTNKGDARKTSPQEGHGGGVYVASGATLAMTGGTITGNKCTGAGSRGGAVYAENTAHFNVQGDVKIYGNTKADSSVEGVYLMGQNLEVTGNLATTAHIDLGVDSHMVAGDSHFIGTASGDAATSGTAANLSAIVAAPFPSNLVAVRNGTTAATIHWAAADTNWLDWVATQSYGWNDGNGGNQVPDGIVIDTPAKLYSLAWAIKNNYAPNGVGTAMGASYANGFYDLTKNLDMTGFTWIPIGTDTIPFTGVFEGYPGAKTITGISYQANEFFGLFGEVKTAGNRTGTWHDIWKTTLIQNIIVDGGGKTWTSGTTTHMGGIAGKATSATIQNCSVRNFAQINILNTVAPVYVGGIVGKTNTCKLLNNTVGQTGGPMTLTSDTGTGAYDAHTGGIVGRAAVTEISGNTVGGSNANRVTIVANPADTLAGNNYAGGVVGYMKEGSITNETYVHLNAMTVRATNNAADATAYAGGVAGYMYDATMTNCTPGANGGEQHLITAQGWNGGTSGKNYAGGLVGGMSGTSSITNSTVGSDAPANYKVTSGAGAESFAGGLVGDATDARIYQCSAESIGVQGGNSGGLAGRFTATNKATAGTKDAPGVMAMCYARNCSVTSAPSTGQYCGMMQTVTNAYILGCYATAATPAGSGVYAVAKANTSNFVGCYSTFSTATTMSADGNATFENCYVLDPTSNKVATPEDATIVGLPADKMTSGGDAELIAALNDGLNDTTNKANYDTMTGNLRMSYMSGNSPEINGNYNYPIYAVWMLTVNSLPSSVYGSYTVTADNKIISAPGATGFNQYWVGKDANIAVTAAQDGYYCTTDPTIDNGTITKIEKDEVVNVTFVPAKRPGWAINTDLSGVKSEPYNDVASGALTATANKLTGNTVKSWVKTAGGSDPWGDNTRTIKTIFVTASTATPGASNPIISAFTADGWQVATGGMNKGYVQLTNAQGADAAAVSAIVNSIEFAASKTSTGDVNVDVQVYVDENIRGSMYYNSANGSIYELAGSPASYASAKLLAETSTFGAKKGHLVVIGDSAEHAFLVQNIKTNAWTAAKSTGDNTILTNWKWDVTGATDVTYLQSQSNWQTGEPNKSGTYATYNYGGKLDDTNGANLALIEYDGKTPSAAGWQAYSALASGTVTCHVDVPVAPNPGPDPEPEPKPDPNRPVDPKITGVANSLETTDHRAYMVGNDQGQFLPDNGITRAEVSQIFYSLLKDKGNSADKASFPDVKAGSWYTPAINTMAALGILSGYPDGSFKPSQCISRAEFTAVAMRFAKMTTGKVAFSDVSKDYWAYDAISGAAAYRWIMGYADGTFRPLANITRAEATRVVNTMLDRAGDKSFIDKATGLKFFPDVAKANWAFYEIVEATNGHNYTRDKAGNELWK